MTEKIWDFIERKKFIIFFMIITLISIYARIVVIDFVSGDYYSCLEPWFYELKENGGLMALKLDIGNYNLPYLTILALLTYLPVEPIISIKMVSIICDYICALAAMKIVYIALKDNKNKDFFALLVYGIILFLPTVLLNSACWGQADSIYVAFILLSIVALLEEKYLKSFIIAISLTRLRTTLSHSDLRSRAELSSPLLSPSLLSKTGRSSPLSSLGASLIQHSSMTSS